MMFDFTNPVFISMCSTCGNFIAMGLCWSALGPETVLQKSLEKAYETWDPFLMGVFKVIRLSTDLCQVKASPARSLWTVQSKAKALACNDYYAKNVS